MISICIPTYEQKGFGVKYLTELLESIKTQEFNDYEICVSDNSTGNSIRLLCEKYNARYQHNPVRGASENINAAIDMANGDKIKLMMQDDKFIHPGALQLFDAALDYHGWAICNSTHINAVGKVTGKRNAEYNPDNFDHNTVGMPSVIGFMKCGLRFDTRLKTFCDLYFYFQLFQLYGKPGMIQTRLVAQRFHNASLSRNQPPSHNADKNFLIRNGLIPGKVPKVVVAVVVYDRLQNIERWKRAWEQCDTGSAELVIIHNGVTRPNIGYDIGAFQDVCRNRLPGFPDYDYLLWCTDDTIPMDKDFITPFIEVHTQGVGLACMQISKEYTPHVRTTGFCIKRELAEKLRFPSDPIKTIAECHYFEHKGGNNTLMRQIQRRGLKCVQVAPLERSPLYDMGFWYRNAQAKAVAHKYDRMKEHEKVFNLSLANV